MRLKSAIWVAAYVRRCHIEGAYAVVRRRGAEEAGAIFVKIAGSTAPPTCTGRRRRRAFDEARPVRARLFRLPQERSRRPKPRRKPIWRVRSASIPDIWIIEVEDRAGSPFPRSGRALSAYAFLAWCPDSEFRITSRHPLSEIRNQGAPAINACCARWIRISLQRLRRADRKFESPHQPRLPPVVGGLHREPGRMSGEGPPRAARLVVPKERLMTRRPLLAGERVLPARDDVERRFRAQPHRSRSTRSNTRSTECPITGLRNRRTRKSTSEGMPRALAATTSGSPVSSATIACALSHGDAQGALERARRSRRAGVRSAAVSSSRIASSLAAAKALLGRHQRAVPEVREQQRGVRPCRRSGKSRRSRRAGSG